MNIKLLELSIVGSTVRWYDYHGLWLTNKTAVVDKIVQLIYQSTGKDVELTYLADGNGYITWSFK